MIETREVVSRLMAFGYDCIDTDMPLIAFAIKKVCDEVKAYLNTDGTPEALDCKIIDAVCAEILSLKLTMNQLPSINELPEKIASMSQGDVSVTYMTDSTPEEKLKLYLESLKIRPIDMDGFRVLVW